MKIFKNWGETVLFCLLVFTLTAFNASISLIIARLADIANTGTVETVLKFLAFCFVFIIFGIIITYIVKNYFHKIVYRYMLRYKNAVYSSALLTKYGENVDSGEYINALTNDAMQIETLYVTSCLTALQEIFSFICGTVVAITIHPLLFILIFVFGCIEAAFMKARSKAMVNATEILSKNNEAYAQNLKSHLEANLLLRMEHLLAWSQRLIFQSTDTALSSHRKQKQAMTKTQITAITIGLLATLVVMGAASILAIYKIVSIGAVLAAGSLIGTISAPIGELGRIYADYKAGKELNNKIKNKFHLSDEEVNFDSTDTLDKINIERISVSNLDFSVEEKHILKNIDFNFEGGKKYAIVGQAGSGKSTLLKLIAGILDSNSHITYNGKILSTSEIFDNICYIPQNITILEDTLEKNICLNKKDCSGSIIEKLALTELAEKRKADGNKIDATVSGGEKQKIAMARALVKDASVFLLDEFNSGLDNYSIKLIEDIVTAQKDKLVIFITHRLNPETLKKCDEILFMQDGKIAEHGNFSALLENNNSLFKNFYENDAEKINNPDAERRLHSNRVLNHPHE